MRRREFLGVISGLAVGFPLSARSQRRSARIGIVVIGRAVAATEHELAKELARIGYVEGRNISYEIVGVDGDLGELSASTQKLVASKSDVLVGASVTVAKALAA